MPLIPRHLIVLLPLFLITSTFAEDKLEVGITRDMDKVEVTVEDEIIVIQRNQNQKHTINPAFAKTSRPCPPFCIQPMSLGQGVETIGELEVIDYLKRQQAGEPVLVVDSRTPDWANRGSIPGAINIPWTKLNPNYTNPFKVTETLVNEFNVKEDGIKLDFSDAKTLVLFCNGMWCGQSPDNIKNLLKLGYPGEKIKWYRGGMQDWEILGLTTVELL